MSVYLKKGQMWGQGQLKGHDYENSRWKKWKFQRCYFAITNFNSMQNVTGSSMVLFYSFCVAYFGKKKNGFENYTSGHFRSFWTIWKPFLYRLTWNLEYIYSIHAGDRYCTVFENFNFWKFYKVFFSRIDLFPKIQGKKFKILKFWANHFVQLNILRLVMFYNLRLLDNWRRSGRLNIGLVLPENCV